MRDAIGFMLFCLFLWFLFDADSLAHAVHVLMMAVRG